MRLETAGIEQLAKHLAADLEPAIQAGAMGIAAALQDIIAPYPPPPASSTYQRTGQTGQGWRIRAIPLGAVLENRVSHSIWVHGSPGQTKVHKKTGWVDEDMAIKQVGGQAAQIMRDALAERLEMMR